MTLADLLDDAKTAFSPEGNSPYSDAWFVRRLNDALNKLCLEFEIPQFEKVFNFSLVSGQRSYDWSSASPGLLFIISLSNTTTSRVLEMITSLEADNYSTSYTGEPGFWLPYGTNLELYPLVNSSYDGNVMQLRYMSRPTQFDAATLTATVPVPDWLYRPLLVLSKAFIYSDGNEPARAVQEYAQYQSLLKAIQPIRGREAAHQRSFTRPTRSF